MPRALTLLSLTFKNQHSPVKIFKNFIFLVIHNTKAALHSSCNPGWYNSTKTHFPEQKVSFSLYHLYRLRHLGRGKLSFIFHRGRDSHQPLQIRIYFCWRGLGHSEDQRKTQPFSGLFPVEEVDVLHLFPAHCYSSAKGWRRREEGTKQEGMEPPQQPTAPEPCPCPRGRVWHCQARGSVSGQEPSHPGNAKCHHATRDTVYTPAPSVRARGTADCEYSPNSPSGHSLVLIPWCILKERSPHCLSL